MTSLHCTSVNVRGLSNYQKRREILQKFWFPTVGVAPHILFLQETHSLPSCETLWKQEFRTKNVYFSHDTAKAGGILLAFRNNVQFHLKHSVMTDSYIIIHCTIDSEEYIFVNVYNRIFPTRTKKYKNDIVQFLQCLWAAISQFNCPHILIGGDFNIKLDDFVAPSTPHSTPPTGQTFLQDFLNDTDMTDCWRLLHPTISRHTFYYKFKGSTLGSHLDYFFASPLLVNYLHEADIGTSFQSDHSPIHISFFLHHNEKGKGLFRFPDHLITDEDYNIVLADTIQDVLDTLRSKIAPDLHLNPALLLDTVKSTIRGRTLEYLSNQKKFIACYKQVDREVRDLQAIIDEWITLGGPTDELIEELTAKQLQLSHLESDIARPIKKRNVTRYAVFNNTCSKYFFKRVKGMPGALRHIFNDHDVLVNSDQEILNVCSTFYENLFGAVNSPSCHLSNYCTLSPLYVLDDTDRQNLKADITKEDLEFALKAMKTNKSPGADGLMVSLPQVLANYR